MKKHNEIIENMSETDKIVSEIKNDLVLPRTILEWSINNFQEALNHIDAATKKLQTLTKPKRKI